MPISAEEYAGEVVEVSKGVSTWENWPLYREHFKGDPQLAKSSGVLESGSAGAKGSLFPKASCRQARQPDQGASGRCHTANLPLKVRAKRLTPICAEGSEEGDEDEGQLRKRAFRSTKRRRKSAQADVQEIIEVLQDSKGSSTEVMTAMMEQFVSAEILLKASLLKHSQVHHIYIYIYISCIYSL